jgi:MFS transporter, AAHS family, 4-hydroxybenzoate transporter
MASAKTRINQVVPNFDVSGFLDERPIGALHIRVLVLCAAIIACDGFDAQALAFVAPLLRNVWDLNPAVLGRILGASVLGMVFGTLLLGSAADYVGRKGVVIFGTALFAAGAVASAMATSPDELVAIRFITGLGLGGVLPSAVALTSEYAPRRHRSLMIMVMLASITLGSALAGFTAGRLIGHYGWTVVFWVGGLLPLALIPLLLIYLPESLSILVKQKRFSRIRAVLTRIDPALTIDPDTAFFQKELRPGRLLVLQLFQQKRAAVTWFLWLVFFMNLLDVYFLNNWLPTLFNTVGLNIQTAIIIAIVFQIGGAAGSFLLGWLIDHFGFHSMLTINFLVSFASILVLGWANNSVALLGPAAFISGACVIGGQGGCNALAADLYPSHVRSTGVGWALGIGRIGSVAGPVVGGIILSAKWKVSHVFAIAALLQLCCGADIALIGFLRARAHANAAAANSLTEKS